MIEKLLKVVLNEGVLVAKKQIASDVFQLSIRSSSIQKMRYICGQHIRVYVGEKSKASGKDNIRTYSIWKMEKEDNMIHIAACTHTNGTGSIWVKTVEVGEKVFFSKPKGKFTIDHSFDSYCFIGDNSALGHLYELHRDLENKEVKGIIYSNSLDELFKDIDDKKPFDFFEFGENPFDEICKLIDKNPDDKSVVYIGGDGRLCVALNKYLIQKGWSRKNIKVKPFWMPNKKGLE